MALKIKDSTGKEILIAGSGLKQDTTLTFGAQQVQTTAWTGDSTYSNYPYKAQIALEGVTANYIPIVNFALTDAISGNLAPISESYNGGVYIYAKTTPTEIINIGSIICVKGA